MTDVRRWAGARGHAVEPHGVDIGPGLVVGVHNLRDDDPLPQTLEAWGFPVAGITRRPHRVPGTSYTVIWTERP